MVVDWTLNVHVVDASGHGDNCATVASRWRQGSRALSAHHAAILIIIRQSIGLPLVFAESCCSPPLAPALRQIQSMRPSTAVVAACSVLARDTI
jgi:hypothetical protein